MKLLYCCLMLFLVSCGRPVQTKSPTGSESYKVKCKQDRGSCLVEASEECKGRPYYVVSEDQHWGGLFADWMPGPVPWWTMVVACGHQPVGYAGASRSEVPQPVYQQQPNPFATPEVRRCYNKYDCGFGFVCVQDQPGRFDGRCEAK